MICHMAATNMQTVAHHLGLVSRNGVRITVSRNGVSFIMNNPGFSQAIGSYFLTRFSFFNPHAIHERKPCI
jgi:hypothetical protein